MDSLSALIAIVPAPPGAAIARGDGVAERVELRDARALFEEGGTLVAHAAFVAGRLGTRASAVEILQALAKAPHAHLEGLMTHFASSANYESGQTEQQIERFEPVTVSVCIGFDVPVRLLTVPPVTGSREHAVPAVNGTIEPGPPAVEPASVT